MKGVTASITALQRLRTEFDADALQFPSLFYCSLLGEGVQNGGVAFPQPDGTYRVFENYLKDHIAEGFPWGQSVGYKYPRSFFFGADLVEGVRRLETRAYI